MSGARQRMSCGAMRSKRSNACKPLKTLNGAICGATAEQQFRAAHVLDFAAEQFAELAEPLIPPNPPMRVCARDPGSPRAALSDWGPKESLRTVSKSTRARLGLDKFADGVASGLGATLGVLTALWAVFVVVWTLHRIFA